MGNRMNSENGPFVDELPLDLITKYEKIPTHVFNDASTASKKVAREIADLIIQKQQKNETCVLGLATGSSPISLYRELIKLHEKEGLSFKNVITFNLDEYYPIHSEALQSYKRFMDEYLFNHIDIPEENINIPDGSMEREDVFKYCTDYENKIAAHGGIDLQVLGIGRTGHIGFNEPGSSPHSETRLIPLDHLTRIDAATSFFGEENVPYYAITMGVGTILKSKRIILLAWGEAKANIIQKAIEGPVTENIPTTYLQDHPHASVYLDTAAAAELTRIKTPWLLGACEWDERLIRKGVVWLCLKVDKPILKLTDRDYADNGMSDLITEHGGSYNINIAVFNDLQHTITGWPGGKPNADDSTRPERKAPFPKKVVIFSPHPDDDVISMGGTLSRLVNQGHDVHVVYQTSGSIAVYDDDVIRFVDFTDDFFETFGISVNSDEIQDKTVQSILNKKPGDVDTKEVIRLKAAIRRSEAKAACRYMGISGEHVHFLSMPFYETGKIKKKPLSEKDIEVIEEVLEKIKPHQVYAAGDLSDPHGTHRVCMQAIMKAMSNVKKQHAWMKDCWLWLYRGAWQEWDIDQADMAVPLSPEEVKTKRSAIFKHQSQKDTPLFPGIDTREFWKRAEDRNHLTAVQYDKLGMAEYQAMELFVKQEF